MPNTVSGTYRTHLDSKTTTLCVIVKIITLAGDTFAFADFESDIDFDDGAGSITYKSRFGLERSNISKTANTSVDNAEFAGLLADVAANGFTLSDIRSRRFDKAEFSVYKVNYKDLSMGLMWLGKGRVGNISITDQAYEVEFRSITQLLKQRGLIRLTSKSCPFVFGDSDCDVDVAALVLTGEVVSVIDPNYEFTIDVIQPDDTFTPGHVEFTSGGNTQIIGIAGALGTEIKTHISNTVTLRYPTPNPIQVSDTLKIRENCEKNPTDCKKFINFPRYGGQDKIPTKDALAVTVPYASSELSPSDG